MFIAIFCVIIVESPTITKSPIDLYVNEGAEARFVCEARGDPLPNITWVKVDDKLDSRRSTVNPDNSLVISNINLSDEGSECDDINGLSSQTINRKIKNYKPAC